VAKSILDEVEEARRKKLIGTIEHARWEAEIVRRPGVKWFEMRVR